MLMSAIGPESDFAAGRHAYRATEQAGSLARATGTVTGSSLDGSKPARPSAALMTGSDKMILNPDHVTIAVADAGPAIEFFALLGFRKDHVATIDGGLPAQYMGM